LVNEPDAADIRRQMIIVRQMSVQVADVGPEDDLAGGQRQDGADE
jgi:hypothetical protein